LEADITLLFQLLRRGEKLLELGRTKEALNTFLKANELSASNSTHVYLGLAICYRQLGQFTSAQQAIRHALALNPEIGDLHFQLGVIYFEQNKFPESILAFEKAVSLEPEKGDFKIGLVEALEKRGNAADIIKTSRLLEEIIKHDPMNAHALRKMAFVAMEAKQYRRAKEYTHRLANLSPEDEALNVLLAELDLREGKMIAARTHYQKVLSDHPGDTMTLYQFYETYTAHNRLWRFITNLIPFSLHNPFITAITSFFSLVLLLLITAKGLPFISIDSTKIIVIFCVTPIVFFRVTRLPTKWWLIWRQKPYLWSWREGSFLFLDLSSALADICFIIFLFTDSNLAVTTTIFLIIYSIFSSALVLSIPFPYQRLAIATLALIYSCALINFIHVVLGQRPPRITDLIAGLSWMALLVLIHLLNRLTGHKPNKS
jgi:tetratricopeptide (TPR) repeat protein